MKVKTHAGREPLFLQRLRLSRDLRRERFIMSKRNNKVTRTGWRYELMLMRNDGHSERTTVTISRRNDKAVIDAMLRLPYVKRVRIRSLSKCLFAMAPDEYYAHSAIITMESVYID